MRYNDIKSDLLDYASSKRGLEDQWYPILSKFDSSIEDGEEFILSKDFGLWFEQNKSDLKIFISGVLKEAKNTIQAMQGKPLYRFMKLNQNPIDLIQNGKRNLGKHWAHTLDLERREFGFGDGNGDYYLFTIRTSIDCINWDTTLTMFVAFNDFENEIVFNEGCGPLQLLKIQELKNGDLIDLDISSIKDTTFMA